MRKRDFSRPATSFNPTVNARGTRRQSKRESHVDLSGCPIKNPGQWTRDFLNEDQSARPRNYFFMRRRISAIPLRQRREVRAGSGTKMLSRAKVLWNVALVQGPPKPPEDSIIPA